MTGSEDGMLRVWPLDFSAVFMEAGDRDLYCRISYIISLRYLDCVCTPNIRAFAIERRRMTHAQSLDLSPTHHVCLSLDFLCSTFVSEMKIFAVCVLVSVLCALGCLALDNGLGRTPQMGWNSWNHFHCGVNQTVLQETADAFIKYGLDKLGYVYVNVDDCWARSRDSNKVVVPDPTTFPDFQGMIKYIHSKGLKFGLYSDAGTRTCAGRPGSLGYEEIDANTYAKWDVDYLKYDNCNNQNEPGQERYTKMRDALNKTGHPIFYSLCNGGREDVATWGSTVGNSWRTTHDIRDNWESIIERADINEKLVNDSGPGGWNDPDMLEVGNGGMTAIEYESHFSLWCLMKAPLLIGCDLRNIDNESLRILTNPEVIAVNQDKLGVQGTKRKIDGTNEVWAGPLDGGAYAVVLLNRGKAASNVTASWSDFGVDPSKEADVRDLWQMKDLGNMKGSVTAMVPSHGVVMYKITPE